MSPLYPEQGRMLDFLKAERERINQMPRYEAIRRIPPDAKNGKTVRADTTLYTGEINLLVKAVNGEGAGKPLKVGDSFVDDDAIVRERGTDKIEQARYTITNTS